MFFMVFFFFQAEDGIRDLVRSRGLGDVYKRQLYSSHPSRTIAALAGKLRWLIGATSSSRSGYAQLPNTCLLYTSDAADERSSVDLGGRRII